MLPTFYSLSLEMTPVAPTYEYKKVLRGSMFLGYTCHMFEIVKDTGVMTVSTSTKCPSLLPASYTVSV